MKIRINKQGVLSVRKFGEYIMQGCPYYASSNPTMPNAFCGLWCPLFYIEDSVGQGDEGQNVISRELQLCGGKKYKITELERVASGR